MLSLSRRVNELIYIGDDIVVKVISIKKNQVRIGVSAPRDVEILRSEIKPRIELKKEQYGRQHSKHL